ncbi:unnamed protein product [Microthlaspi erraticum]|uniref:Uncharacterized protein n=1 Tax=Microthlaspi erraticum TaxID=1685480 RepID=A0A6D2JKX5_9BRAS|nr:unnamed protein product [Microthlaspi erraticum]
MGKFNAQHASRLGIGTKEAFLYRFARGPIMFHHHPSYSQHHPSSPDINKHLFCKESSQAAPTKIEVMLQEIIYSKYKRERSPTPNLPPFYCNAITRRSTIAKSMRTMKKKKESMRNNLNDEDEEQSIDINASPKQSKDTPSPRPSFLTTTTKSSF